MKYKLRPSAAKRFINCPGSARMNEGRVEKVSPFAEEGTAAHALSERCLTGGFNAARFLGWHIFVKDSAASMLAPDDLPSGRAALLAEGHSEWAVDDEMVGHVQAYIDFVRGETGADGELYVEETLSLPELPGYKGTADAIVHKADARKLIVIDLKYGRGVAVGAEENPQALSYAAMALRRFHNHAIDEIEIVIVQPRAQDGEPVKRWSTSYLALFDWVGDLIDAAARAEDSDAPLAAGDWCKFCPSRPDCPEAEAEVARLLDADFDEANLTLPDPSSFDPARAAAMLHHIKRIEDWCHAFRAYCLDKAEVGATFPGWRLVPKRAFKKWNDPEDVTALDLLRIGLDKDDIYEAKLRTPAQILKKAKAAQKPQIEPLFTAVSSGVTLAPETDGRPSATPDAAADFD